MQQREWSRVAAIVGAFVLWEREALLAAARASRPAPARDALDARLHLLDGAGLKTLRAACHLELDAVTL
jgi:hypothetical protein